MHTFGMPLPILQNRMSLDGGFSGSLEESMANLSIGRRQGHEAGYQEGLDDGFTQGRNSGWKEGHEVGRVSGNKAGWDAGVVKANLVIAQQIAISRELQADKVSLTEMLAQQAKQIAALDEKFQQALAVNQQALVNNATLFKEAQTAIAAKAELARQLDAAKASQKSDNIALYELKTIVQLGLRPSLDKAESENGKLLEAHAKKCQENDELRTMLDALKDANARLQEQVLTLDANLKKETAEHTEVLWQFNRAAVFMNAVREVLEDITDNKTPEGQHVKLLFAERYSSELKKSLEKGTIKGTPEEDISFANRLPKTQEFILTMLSSIGTNSELNLGEEWVPSA